ncbi:MAG: membrane dipeptidase, partial [Bacteroidales bacterium]|nr:membrane dipeptidase [Bacteroidales bacterium]
NLNNDICDASMDKASEHNGLSAFGKEVVKEMNRLGIIIDVSHASVKTVLDVVKLSKYPVMASHSGVYSLKNHNRNLRDHEMKAIAQAGGLIQIATGRFFLSELPKDSVTVSHIADHIDYARSLVGIDHIGLGTDFDGGGGVVGLENVSKMKNLTIELLRRGYTPEDLEKFWGANFIRFLKHQNL